MSFPEPLYLGIDFGTSGARAIAIGADGQMQEQASVLFGADPTAGWEAAWRTTLVELLESLSLAVRRAVRAIAINGTSSTVMLCDAAGHFLTEPLFYNDARGGSMLAAVAAIAPPDHTVLSATSSLAKLYWWRAHQPLKPAGQRPYFVHQADWLSFLLHGRIGISDYHNALKLGYDVGELRYPDWMQPAGSVAILPRVLAPGMAIAPITPHSATRFGLPADCLVRAGTTDSIAAFLASGAQAPGAAVTSLGSTLVLKLLSQTRVESAQYGIYSHRLGSLWLVGGASNTGGAVLRQFFSDAELDRLSQQLQPNQPSPLDYYPLSKPGERFPINDPSLQPRLEPRPSTSVEFLHGMLEAIARIEALGYQRLQELGATPLTQVYTAGGGAKNAAWTQMRSRHLHVPVSASCQMEAAYGSALLARDGAIE